MYVGVVFVSMRNLFSMDPSMSIEHEIDIAPRRFSCEEWDYLTDNYAVGIVEPVAGQTVFSRRLGESGCVAPYRGENVGYVKKQMCYSCRCKPEDILVVTEEMGTLSDIIKDWRL